MRLEPTNLTNDDHHGPDHHTARDDQYSGLPESFAQVQPNRRQLRNDSHRETDDLTDTAQKLPWPLSQRLDTDLDVGRLRW
jgi:hypothetical protein